MASGLNWDEGKHPLSHNAEGYYGEDLKGLISRLKSINEPGVTFNYQSGNTQILGFILEKATGKTTKKKWSTVSTNWSSEIKGRKAKTKRWRRKKNKKKWTKIKTRTIEVRILRKTKR